MREATEFVVVEGIQAVPRFNSQGKAVQQSEAGELTDGLRADLNICLDVQLLDEAQFCKSCKVCFCKDAAAVCDGEGLQ